jgi:hypothetical protein
VVAKALSYVDIGRRQLPFHLRSTPDGPPPEATNRRQSGQIEFIDEDLDPPDRIALGHIVV